MGQWGGVEILTRGEARVLEFHNPPNTPPQHGNTANPFKCASERLLFTKTWMDGSTVHAAICALWS